MISGIALTVALGGMLNAVRCGVQAGVYYVLKVGVGNKLENASVEVKHRYAQFALSIILSVMIALSGAFIAGMYA